MHRNLLRVPRELLHRLFTPGCLFCQMLQKFFLFGMMERLIIQSFSIIIEINGKFPTVLKFVQPLVGDGILLLKVYQGSI